MRINKHIIPCILILLIQQNIIRCVAFTSNVFALSSTSRNSKWTTILHGSAFDILKDANVINPITGEKCKALDDILEKNRVSKYILVVVMPQLGDFDSAEYAEMLSAVEDDLDEAQISLRVIGIGDEASAQKFSSFNKLNLDLIRIDKTGALHRALDLHAGPNWDVPAVIPNWMLEWFADYVGAKDHDRDSNAIARSWLNYMAMCAGIAAPDTLKEIFRGYFGDKNAPERIKPDEIVTVGDKNDPFITIKGISDVKVGPFQYEQLWKDEKGYQRPVELATVRLRVMVEVLSNFHLYVKDHRFLDLRGATFLFDGVNNNVIYEHIDTGVLSYSKTMGRPLSYLKPYIGEKALNPLGLGDPGS